MISVIHSANPRYRVTTGNDKLIIITNVIYRFRSSYVKLIEIETKLTNVRMRFMNGQLTRTCTVVRLWKIRTYKIRTIFFRVLSASCQNYFLKKKNLLERNKSFKTLPVLTNLQTQQIPKPLAQGPLDTPPRSSHSADVKQVPLSPEDAPQPWFWNSTTVKSERTKKKRS